ncbi:uncharacterized protein LOC106875502 isoform X2 [Octopus bimaculoides]|uniref:uncharacterized protein LOC106875502 isoform X2 n=1 Tax=Octopus bimaculoides TaxID=37653 RepID=UPI00071CF9D1|nr:uncharacterized protein LOC106875502 isoform X2 [Octopus bimaculoides]XP_014779164.1 uncharacterized protein LOC106875502 isoform X2 [Octopus bimaculoides]XP_052824885.1 uncharacterized protein LOC106875502 isoform X2 [Octopus bimaculoides]|eukprot:XP_014779162.1 PREDICTED: uncharacterized protein LOC106875502 isoform X2 [Octopus bimaculoides]
MASIRVSLFIILYIFSVGLTLLVHCRRHDDEEEEKKKMSCTYFDPRRFPEPQHGLVNCSWYAPNACCKRTEVTSVFSNMYPLYGASKACMNRMNYLMCYFCSPEQGIWYHGKMSVCEEYCVDIYNECRLASYEGTSIGSAYGNGTAFCNAQNFDVVEGTHNCFEFDPLPFAAAISLTSTSVILYTFCAASISLGFNT